jgi:hypothetical protein
MKHLFLKSTLLLSLIVFLYGCFLFKDEKAINETLNGVSYQDAKGLVGNFRKDSTSSDSRTSIWLSKKWVVKVYSILKKECASGIRFYFAKKANNKNSLVIVSTRDTNSIHYDYFEHKDPFFNTKSAKFDEKYDLSQEETLFYDNTNPCGNKDCSIPPTDKHSINCKTASDFINNSSKKGTPINTHNVWISIDLIESFTNKFKEIDDDDSEKKGKIDGLRIYFAKTTKIDSTIKPDQNTIVFVTTVRVKHNVHKDYFNCSKIHFTLLATSNTITTSTTDKAEICPPGDCKTKGAAL